MARKAGVLVSLQGMILLLILGFNSAYGQIGRAELAGTVKDQTEAVIPGAQIRATHVATGAVRETASDARGNYVLPSLDVGEYVVVVEMPGFTMVTRRGVNLLVGQRATINFELQPASVVTQVEVTAAAPLVETTKSDVAANIDVKQMESLPLVGRDWLSMLSTAPGVRSSGTGVPSVGALESKRTGVFVDGNSIKDSTGRSSTVITYSQEAVREAQIVTNRMSAEYGNAAGGVVSAVTKSGTNELHGSVYGFFRDAKLNANDFFTGTKEPFSNKNYGGTIGGPIVRDKLFYFGNVELTRRTQNGSISVGVPELDRTYPNGSLENVGFLRLDYNISPNHMLALRGAYDYSSVENNSVALTLTGWDFTTQTWNAGFTLTSLLGAKGVNEFRYNFLPSNWQRKMKSEFPGLLFPTGRLGTPRNSPWTAAAHFNQLANATTYSFSGWGSHTLKAGASFDYENMYGAFGNNFFGEFLMPRNPTNWTAVLDVVYRGDRIGLQKLVDQGIVPVPSSAAFGIGDITYKTPQRLVGFYVQEDWRMNPRMTLNLGLRWDADFGGFLGLKTRFTETYGATKNDIRNWAPRIGFAFDLTGKGTTVARGGVGRYYDLLDSNSVFAHKVFNGDSYAVAATFPGSPPRSDFMINPLGTLTLKQIVEENLAPSNIRPFASDLRTAYTDQMAIGVAHQFTENLGLAADFLHIISTHQLEGIMINSFCDPVTRESLPVRKFGSPDPRYNNIQLVTSGGHSRYEGLQLGLTRRFSDNFQFVTAYTLSWSYSSASDSRGGTSNFTELCDRSLLRGVSEQDQRHRGTFNVVYQLPFGFQVGGIVFATSAQRFEVRAGRDLDGNLLVDDLARNPDGTKMPRVSGVGDTVFRVDLRLSKTFALTERHNVELIVEGFNIFNRKNYGSYQGNQSARNFLQPVRSTDLNFQPFQAQLGLRYRF
ncbi:MAG: TonB-dependent receptor [Acidobacteria bacterium]|nr:TonB-dependent receptor [Acidobacteriota bacterium]